MHLGIDLGGNKIEIIALDDNSSEKYRKRIPSPQHDYAATLSALTQLVEEAEHQLGPCASLGIGIPGALSLETGLIKNANSTWLIGKDLKGDLSTALSRELFIANDADCFTLSEACDGAARNGKIVFGVILGTGVGGGICIGRQLVSGPNAISGEWGHNPLPRNNIIPDSVADPQTTCYCGKYNCIETYLSGPAFLAHYKQTYPDQSKDINNAQEIAQAISANEPQALDYFSHYCDRLARSLTLIINILDPDVIVLGGGLSNIDALYRELPTHIERYVFSDSLRTNIVKAEHGDSSGVRGAAWLGKNLGRMEAP